MNTVDLDRLHHNTEMFDRGELLHRGTGKTTVIIEKLIGSALVSPPMSSFLVMGQTHQYMDWLSTRVFSRLVEYGETPKYIHGRHDIFLQNGTHLMFTTPVGVYQRVQGIRLVNFYIDDYDEFLRLYIDKADDILSFLESRCI